MKGVAAQLQHVNVVEGRCDTALPRVYTQSGVSAHHHRETALALDRAPLLEPPIQHGMVVDTGPRKFRGKQAAQVAEVVVCVGRIDKDDVAVWFGNQRDAARWRGKRLEFHPTPAADNSDIKPVLARRYFLFSKAGDVHVQAPFLGFGKQPNEDFIE